MNTIVVTFRIQRADTAVTTIIVPDDYPTIHEAVDAASSGDTIFVKTGLYVENTTITIDKSLTLIGEDRDEVVVTTIQQETPYSIVSIADDVGVLSISGFTIVGDFGMTRGISGGGDGGEYTIVNNRILFHWDGIAVSCYNVSDNVFFGNGKGILMGGSCPKVVTNNEFVNNGAGIMMSTLWNAEIQNNVFYGNGYGMAAYYFSEGDNFTITENIFIFNEKGMNFNDAMHGLHVTAYHNDFVNNSIQIDELPTVEGTWDNGYSSGGNYWSDYNGIDLYGSQYQNVTGSDGIGDTPNVFQLVVEHIDHYPLMTPYQYIPGDVNGDRKVRIDDILTIALAFGSNLGDLAFRPLMDITGDEKIRIDDILAAAMNFGLGE